jgi:hypothetical protein
MMRLAAAMWGSTQDTMNITCDTYVKSVMKYGSEVIDDDDNNNNNNNLLCVHQIHTRLGTHWI